MRLVIFVRCRLRWHGWALISTICGSMVAHAISMNMHDKNTIIASQDKNHASSFNKNKADKLLERVENTVTRNYCITQTDRAYAMVNSMERVSGVGNNYLPYALRLAFLDDHNLVYHSWESHRSVRNIDTHTACCIAYGFCPRVIWKYVMILFG